MHVVISSNQIYILIRQDVAAELAAEAQVHPIQQGALIQFTTKPSAAILDSNFSCWAMLAQPKLTISSAWADPVILRKALSLNLVQPRSKSASPDDFHVWQRKWALLNMMRTGNSAEVWKVCSAFYCHRMQNHSQNIHMILYSKHIDKYWVVSCIIVTY